MDRKFDLGDRLIKFAAGVIEIAHALPSTYAGNHLSNQLIRSGTSPALNYAEAQGAESTADFIHKLKIAHKELRETYACLRIIALQNWVKEEKLSGLIDENNQLIAIIVTCIDSARKKQINSPSNKTSSPNKQEPNTK